MKTACEIIKDLLPLYHDKVCSSQSNVLVEEHLKECPACVKLLAAISEELTLPINTMDEAKPIKAIQVAWKKDKRNSLLKGAALTVAACAILVGGFLGLTQLRVVPVSADSLVVLEAARLSDGRLAFQFLATDFKELDVLEYTETKDGLAYIQPKRPILCGTRPYEDGNDAIYYDVDTADLSAIYVGTADNNILIWENGMEIPAADEYIEDMFLPQSPVLAQMQEYHLEYVGDSVGVGKLLSFLPQFDENFVQNMFSLQTDAEPYGVIIYYEPTENNSGYTMHDHELYEMETYAGYLFECIDNLGYVEYAYRTTPSDNKVDESAYISLLGFSRP